MKQKSSIFSELLENIEQQKEKRKEHLAEIAGSCPEHGGYTRGQSMETGGRCPYCWQKEEEMRRKRLKHALFLERSDIPRRFRECSLGDFLPPTPDAEKVLGAIQAYTCNFLAHEQVGRSLVLCGRTGTGKTMLACAACRHIMLEYEKQCRYATAYHIVRDIKDTYGSNASERAVVRGYVEPDLLVVDEVGVQYGTDAEKILLFEVLNGRYEEVKSTIVISNLEPVGMGDHLGDRVMDRLMDNGGAVLVFDWQSHRGRK